MDYKLGQISGLKDVATKTSDRSALLALFRVPATAARFLTPTYSKMTAVNSPAQDEAIARRTRRPSTAIRPFNSSGVITTHHMMHSRRHIYLQRGKPLLAHCVHLNGFHTEFFIKYSASRNLCNIRFHGSALAVYETSF